jgi:signal transduction histidine kinase
MHDVLAHRLSLLSVHAGALEFHPDAPAAEVQRAAAVIRDSAHQALQDLRTVIGVLRAPTAEQIGAEPPQPTLADLDRLVAESRAAGAQVEVQQRITDPGTVPADTGRTVYRIVQEGLTNARKHAPGAPVRVDVRRGPGADLTVEVRNPLPTAALRLPIPGAGQGLSGLVERVTLAGGGLEHGTDGQDFVLRARLPWCS